MTGEGPTRVPAQQTAIVTGVPRGIGAAIALSPDRTARGAPPAPRSRVGARCGAPAPILLDLGGRLE
jgi:hypothetical protein